MPVAAKMLALDFRDWTLKRSAIDGRILESELTPATSTLKRIKVLKVHS